MTTNDFYITLTSTADPTRRRAALNRVYSILLELAEKAADPGNFGKEQEPAAMDECVKSKPPRMLGGGGVAGSDGRDNIHDRDSLIIAELPPEGQSI